MADSGDAGQRGLAAGGSRAGRGDQEISATILTKTIRGMGCEQA